MLMCCQLNSGKGNLMPNKYQKWQVLRYTPREVYDFLSGIDVARFYAAQVGKMLIESNIERGERIQELLGVVATRDRQIRDLDAQLSRAEVEISALTDCLNGKDGV